MEEMQVSDPAFKKKADEKVGKLTMELAKELTGMRGGSTHVGGPGSVHVVIVTFPLIRPDPTSTLCAAEYYSVHSSFGQNPMGLLAIAQALAEVATMDMQPTEGVPQ